MSKEANMSEDANLKTSFSKLLKYRRDDYNNYGRYLVTEFTYANVWLRIISFLGDLVIMLLPVIIWVDVFLLVTTGLVPISGLYAIMTSVMILVLLFVLLGNTYISYLFDGQSFGKVCMRFKTVNADNSSCKKSTIILRELLGKALPIVVLYILLGFLGVLIFCVINGLVVVIDKKHRSIIDFILKTKTIMLSPKGMVHAVDDVIVTKPVRKAPTPKIKVENIYDLHVYSSFSHDGEYEVEDLFKMAKERGIQTLSICDHNSVKANLIAKQLVPLYEINYIPGINIDCEYEGYHVRLLGYGINSNDERFAKIEYENLAKEKAISLRRVSLFEEFTGLKVDSDALLAHNRFQIISPNMIARHILSNTDYQKNKLLQPYLSGNKKDTPIASFVEDFFAIDKPAYVPIIQPKLVDMIALVKSCGGKCIMAHPAKSFKNRLELLEHLIVKEGIDGIEVFTPYHTNNDIKVLLDIVKKYDLVVSEGSEFHGTNKKSFEMGVTHCPKDAEIIVKKFIDKIAKIS